MIIVTGNYRVAPEQRDRFMGSKQDQVARTRRALDQVATGPQPALVVAHVGTIRAAMLALGRRPPPEADVAHAQIIELPWPASGITGQPPA